MINVYELKDLRKIHAFYVYVAKDDIGLYYVAADDFENLLTSPQIEEHININVEGYDIFDTFESFDDMRENFKDRHPEEFI